MPDKKEFLTYCNIPMGDGAVCGELIVKTPGIQAPVVGGEPTKLAKKYVQAITDHMGKKHPQLFAYGLNTMEQYIGFFSLGMVRTDDPGAHEFIHVYAQHLCRMATLPITDESLQKYAERIAVELQYTMEDPKRAKLIQLVTNALQYARDFTARKMAGQPAAPAVETGEEVPAEAQAG